MTGSYDPGQWIATGVLIGIVIGWYLRRRWCSFSTKGCEHRWSGWIENLDRSSIPERYRFCLNPKCMKVDIEGKEVE